MTRGLRPPHPGPLPPSGGEGEGFDYSLPLAGRAANEESLSQLRSLAPEGGEGRGEGDCRDGGQ